MFFTLNDPIFRVIFWILFVLIIWGGAALHALLFCAYFFPLSLPRLRQSRARLVSIVYSMTLIAALAAPAVHLSELHSGFGLVYDIAAALISLVAAAHILFATRQWLLAIGPVLGWTIAVIPLHLGHVVGAIIAWHAAALAITILWRLTSAPEPAPPAPPQSTLLVPASPCPSPSPSPHPPK